MEKKLIYEKMVAILRGTKAIEKGRKNQTQNFMYRGIDEIMNDMHALFAEHGVIIVPEVVEYNVNTETTAKGSKLFYTRARIRHHFVAYDGSEICTETIGEAMDSGDKGMNKAMSIALKYAMLQLFLIPTKEDKDPDGQSYEVSGVPQAGANSIKDAIVQVKKAKTEQELIALWSQYVSVNPAFGMEGSEFYNAWIARRGEVVK